LTFEQGAPTMGLTISLKDLNSQLINKSQWEQNLIVIEIENDILDMGGHDFPELMTVSAKIDIQGKETTYTDVKASLVNIEERIVLYYYLVFDICAVNEKSNIYL